MDEYSAFLPKQQAASNVLNMANRLSVTFPPMNPKIQLTEPATIVDERGCILVWYLPDILLRDRKVCAQRSSSNCLRYLTTECLTGVGNHVKPRVDQAQFCKDCVLEAIGGTLQNSGTWLAVGIWGNHNVPGTISDRSYRMYRFR